MAKRFVGGPTGPQLPPVDDDWFIERYEKYGIRISNNATGHCTLLGFDQIREFTADPVRGQEYGKLLLKTQVHIGGNHLWTEPISPGGPVPDHFENMWGWDRANDAAYIRSPFLSPAPPVMPQPAWGNPALGFGLLACIGIGVVLLIASD